MTDARENLIAAEQRKAVAVERVVQASLLVASERFDQKAEDPGWQAELYDEMLDEMIVECAAAINTLKHVKAVLEGRV